MIDVVMYHNPECGTSRNTLGLIRNAGIEPHLIEYLKCPPSRVMLKSLIARMGLPVRDVVRIKGTPYHDLGLDSPALTEDALLDAVRHTPHAEISMRISPAAGTGTGRSRITKGVRGRSSTIARNVFDPWWVPEDSGCSGVRPHALRLARPLRQARPSDPGGPNAEECRQEEAEVQELRRQGHPQEGRQGGAVPALRRDRDQAVSRVRPMRRQVRH
jgi:arsenate reductase (glutaredoxin)